jgi:hypothetical protein
VNLNQESLIWDKINGFEPKEKLSKDFYLCRPEHDISHKKIRKIMGKENPTICR